MAISELHKHHKFLSCDYSVDINTIDNDETCDYKISDECGTAKIIPHGFHIRLNKLN